MVENNHVLAILKNATISVLSRVNLYHKKAGFFVDITGAWLGWI
jgi:hypothetical protein